MTITPSKVLLVVAFVFLLIAGILEVAGGHLGMSTHGWAFFGLSAWVLALLV